jgi:hypothetical protein
VNSWRRLNFNRFPYFVTFLHGGPVLPGRDSAVGSPPIQAGQQAVAGTQRLHEEETTPSGGEYQQGSETVDFCQAKTVRRGRVYFHQRLSFSQRLYFVNTYIFINA